MNFQAEIDHIRKFYASVDDKFVPLQNKLPQDLFLFTTNSGIGDSLVLFLFKEHNENTKKIKTFYNPAVANALKKYNEYMYSIIDNSPKNARSLFVCEIQDKIRYPGHFIQNIQYCIGIPVQDVPRPILNNPSTTVKNRVVMTFDRGAHGQFQTNIHPKPRILYDEHKSTIEQFIKDNDHKYEFIEVGKTSSNIKGVINQTNLGIEKTAELIGSCEYFFGIHNGLMHIAAAFQKKSIIIVNFPKAHEIVLPILKRTNYPDIDWLYPQNVHLHQDEDSYLVPKLSYDSIVKAFEGNIYPYYNQSCIIEIQNYV